MREKDMNFFANAEQKPKKKGRSIPKCVRPEEFRALIQVIPRKHIKRKIAFLLAYGSGMRISEVLRCTAVHFRENSIFIPESKYGVERVVPIPKGWKKEFLSQLPLNMSARNLQIAFKLHSKKANLPDYYTFHSLRHGFATRLVENGVPINQIQLLMGHSNIATTSVYLKANPIDAIKSYEDLF